MKLETAPASASVPARGTVGIRGVLDVRDVRRTFGDVVALDGLDLVVGAGEIHALLGPNGAGKTTLLRIVSGLTDPTEGSVHVLGLPSTGAEGDIRGLIGFIPSGDRTFYLRMNGVENLVFFARLSGLRRAEAVRRAREMLATVGLEHAGDRRVATYSHGMHKRLSIARALMLRPPLLLVDEATHDLDPEGAGRVQGLVRDAAAQGTAVLWTTQRLDEVRGFADRVTVLAEGRARFLGSVPELMAMTENRSYALETRGVRSRRRLVEIVGTLADIQPVRDAPQHWLVVLSGRALLGDVVARLANAGVKVVACREERSTLELAFLELTGTGEA